MENASKALIIAGAILLSILIIGLGMYIFNQAKSAAGGTKLDSQKVSAYNSEFEQYEGTQSGANTRALYQALISHNRLNQDDVSLQIQCTVNDTAVKTVTPVTDAVEPGNNAPTLGDLSKIKTGGTYFVYFQYGKSGYITSCTITRLSN